MRTNVPLSLAVLAAAAQGDFTIGQTVETSSGAVQGHAAADNSSVSAYLGIPFAEPPVGDLRFAPPQAVNKTSSGQTINGSDFGFSCLGAQLYPVSPDATGLTKQGREIYDEWDQVDDKFSEDCLTLNVWTKPQDGDAKKAVLLWIYGGGFFAGGSSMPLYNGRVFADEQDVVVVSINCRSNFFIHVISFGSGSLNKTPCESIHSQLEAKIPLLVAHIIFVLSSLSNSLNGFGIS